MIAYFCDQCQKQIPEKSLKTAPKPGEALLCANCLRTQEKSAPNQIVCEGCQAPILPIDLKTGKAFIREQAFYCARCVRKLTQHTQSIQHQKITQIFLFFGFPLLTAIILFAIFSSLSSSPKNNSDEKNSSNTNIKNENQYSQPVWTEQDTLINKTAMATGTLSTEELLKLQEKAMPSKTDPLKNTNPDPQKEIQKRDPPITEMLPNPPSNEKLKQLTNNLRNASTTSVLDRLDQPATQLLALLELKEATPEILQKIHNSFAISPDPLLRATSARVLGVLQSPTSVELLIRMMSDPEKIVRLAAKEAVKKITNDNYTNIKDLNLSEDVQRALTKALREKD